MSRWYLYVLVCNDGSYYAGVTPDIRARLAKHRSGKGSKYVARKSPCWLYFTLRSKDMDKSYAHKVEYRFKRLERDQKEKFMCGEGNAYHRLISGLSDVVRTIYSKNSIVNCGEDHDANRSDG